MRVTKSVLDFNPKVVAKANNLIRRVKVHPHLLYGDRTVTTETYKGKFLRQWYMYDVFLYLSVYGCGNYAAADELLVAA